jgi:hypothetical protein
VKNLRFEYKLVAIVVILASLSYPSISQTRDPKQDAMWSLMESGRNLQQKGHLLFASSIFGFVRDHSTDTNAQAEAIYRSVGCGDEEANILTIQLSALSHLRALQNDSALENELSRIRETEAVAFQHIGIPLKLSRYSNAFVNADTISRRLLTSIYRYTPFGELTAFELTENEASPGGLVGLTEPNVVIKRSLAFLSDYPHSTYVNDVHLVLGQALQDLWTCSLPDMIDYSDVLTESQKSNPHQLRLEAIRYLQQARESRNHLIKHKWDRYHDEGLDSLRAKQHTHILYYVSD